MLIARNGHDHRLLRIAAATAQLFGRVIVLAAAATVS